MNTITINDIKIEFSNKNLIYITKDEWTICINDSIEGEKILSHWLNFVDNTYKNSVIEY